MLDTLWLILLITGILLFIVSLFMMLYWKVFNLIDEISGRKAKRQIAKLREYNNSTGEMTSVSTGELELMMAGGGSLLDETVTKVDPGERSLKDMIDDPYGSVGKGAVKKPTVIKHKREPKEELPKQSYTVDEEVTGLFEDIAEEIKSKKSIIILDEQSSI